MKPSKDDFKGMHDDAVSLMDSIESAQDGLSAVAAVAKRMARFSAAHLSPDEMMEDEEEEDEESSREKKKKLAILKIKRIKP